MGDLIRKSQRRHPVLCSVIVLVRYGNGMLREPLNSPSQASRERSTQEAEQDRSTLS